MDYVVVGIVALLAVLYLFRRFWNIVKRKDVSCGGCDGACGNALSGCNACGPPEPGHRE